LNMVEQKQDREFNSLPATELCILTPSNLGHFGHPSCALITFDAGRSNPPLLRRTGIEIRNPKSCPSSRQPFGEQNRNNHTTIICSSCPYQAKTDLSSRAAIAIMAAEATTAGESGHTRNRGCRQTRCSIDRFVVQETLWTKFNVRVSSSH
jgi:hypothetical protein